MKKATKSETAEDLMSRLVSDPGYVAKRAQADAERAARVAEWRRAEAPLIEDLRAAGVDVASAWDLVNTSAPYPAALPILLAHLQRDYPSRVREGIARALAVPESKFAWDVLLRLYEEEEGEVKAGVAVAISAIAEKHPELLSTVIGLVRDKRHGSSRLLLLSVLERARDPHARTVLVELESDPDLVLEIRAMLKRLSKRRR